MPAAALVAAALVVAGCGFRHRALAVRTVAPDDELLAAELARLDGKLEAVDAGRRRLLDVYQASLAELPELQRRTTEVERRRHDLGHRRGALTHGPCSVSLSKTSPSPAGTSTSGYGAPRRHPARTSEPQPRSRSARPGVNSRPRVRRRRLLSHSHPAVVTGTHAVPCAACAVGGITVIASERSDAPAQQRELLRFRQHTCGRSICAASIGQRPGSATYRRRRSGGQVRRQIFMGDSTRPGRFRPQESQWRDSRPQWTDTEAYCRGR